MRFVPYIYGKDNTQIPVSILPMSVQDAVQTDTEPFWQTSWTSEYLSDPRLEKYAVRLNDELIALGAYEIQESALVVHIFTSRRSQRAIRQLLERIANTTGSAGY